MEHRDNVLFLVTDHRFIQRPDGRIADDFVFDRSFFDDYLDTFDRVIVWARRKQSEEGGFGRLSDEPGLVDFVFGRQGLSALRVGTHCCVRLPSSLALAVAPLLTLRYRRSQLSFELIGEPSASIVAMAADDDRSLRARVVLRVMGGVADLLTRMLLGVAGSGSYVAEHLYRNWPCRDAAYRAVISSIRLREDDYAPPRHWVARDSSEPRRVLCIASLESVKNHVLTIEAVAKARGDLNIQLNVVGDGPMRAEIQQRAATLGIGRFVRFLGHISDRAELRRIIDDSDIGITSSRSEGMPRACIEMMARGLPVIASDIPAHRELLDRHLLVPLEDASAMAALLVEVLQGDELYRKSSVVCRNLADAFAEETLGDRRRALHEYLLTGVTSRD